MKTVQLPPVRMKDVIFYARQFSGLTPDQLQETLDEFIEKSKRLEHKDFRPQLKAIEYLQSANTLKVA